MPATENNVHLKPFLSFISVKHFDPDAEARDTPLADKIRALHKSSAHSTN